MILVQNDDQKKSGCYKSLIVAPVRTTKGNFKNSCPPFLCDSIHLKQPTRAALGTDSGGMTTTDNCLPKLGTIETGIVVLSEQTVLLFVDQVLVVLGFVYANRNNSISEPTVNFHWCQETQAQWLMEQKTSPINQSL